MGRLDNVRKSKIGKSKISKVWERRNLAKLRETIAGQAGCCEGLNLAQYDIVSFGAGKAVPLCWECLESEGIRPKYFADMHGMWEKPGCGKMILPEVIKRKCVHPIALISSSNAWTVNQMRRQMYSQQIESLLVDKLVFSRHCSEILQVFDMLEDRKSKYVYGEVLLARMEGAEIPEELITGQRYFCLAPFLRRSGSEIYADFGAAVGDSIEEYIWKKKNVFGKIYGFEPEQGNFKVLAGRMERLKREWGILDGQIALFQEEIGGKISVDSLFGKARVDFVKVDIGGREIGLLCGARKTVAGQKPLLAISIYHSPSDMFRIPLMVKSMNPDYRLKIRHHSVGYAETVLYAY